MGARSIKPGVLVLKFEKGEYLLPSKDRTGAQQCRFRQRPEWEALCLSEDPFSEDVDCHLRLLFRLPHPDVEGPAVDFLLPNHGDVRYPFLLRAPDFLRERVARVVEVGAHIREAVEQGSGMVNLFGVRGTVPDLSGRVQARE